MAPFAAGSIPGSLGNLKKLSALALNFNRLTGHSIFVLGWSVTYDHPNFDCFLSLFAEGRLPETLGNLGQLEFLDLSNNNLEGFLFSFEGDQPRPYDQFSMMAYLFCPCPKSQMALAEWRNAALLC